MISTYWIAVLAGFVFSIMIFLTYAGKPGALAYTPPSDSKWLEQNITERFVSDGKKVATDVPVTTTMPQQNALKIYINSFNALTTDSQQNTVSMTMNLKNVTGFIPIKQFESFEKVLLSILNLSKNALELTSKGQKNETIVALTITYSSASAARAAITTLPKTLVSPDTLKKLQTVFPKLNGVYVSSMPALTASPTKNANNTYFCQTNRWCDVKNKGINFFLNSSGNIPATVKSDVGLPLKDVSMIGPPSNTLSSAQNNYVLESFTCTWYMKFNNLIFDNTQKPIVWYKMFAETPNRVQLLVYENGADGVKVQVTIGNMNEQFEWAIPKTTLMSNGNPTLYALVYNKEESKATFYIGNVPYTAKINVNSKVPVKLGLTQLVINDLTRGHVSLDANLMAFTYYGSVLSQVELVNLAQYFQTEAGGLSKLKKLSEEQAAKAAKLESELSRLTTTNSQLLQELQKQPKCAAPTTSAPEPEEPQAQPSMWQIKLDNQYNNVNTLRFSGKKYSKVFDYGEQPPAVENPVNPEKPKTPVGGIGYPSSDVLRAKYSSEGVHISNPVVSRTYSKPDNAITAPPINQYYAQKHKYSARLEEQKEKLAAKPAAPEIPAPTTDKTWDAAQCGDGSVFSKMFLKC